MFNIPVSEMNFGEYDAFDEDQNDPQFFENTFIDPFSFSMNTIRNNRNFIIVGRKGAGKTAAQIHLMKVLQNQGYITSFFSFFDGVTNADYAELARTQQIDLLKIDFKKNIFNYYDYRPIWERVIYIQIAKSLRKNGIDNSFTSFVLANIKGNIGLFSGIMKSLKVETSIDISIIKTKLSFDPKPLIDDKGSISIDDFNSISRELLISDGGGLKHFLFIDELVFSKLDARDDEVKARAALIRDVLRVARDLNRCFVQNKIDFHIVCTLRPEIRNFLNDLDAEISKIIDSRDVMLHWNIDSDDEHHILIKLLKAKISFGAGDKNFPVDHFIDQHINVGGKTIKTYAAILNRSWQRPRDIVRFLKSYQKTNPDHFRITEDGIRKSEKEYARVSAKEIIDELSVSYDQNIVGKLKNAIRKKDYRNAEDLKIGLSAIKDTDTSQLIRDLYHAGVIGNVNKVGEKNMYYWSYKEEESLFEDMKIHVHPGLWEYLNIT